jgi:DNA-binding transcriptional MocR family regulator
MSVDTEWSERFSAYGKRAVASEIRELLKLLDRPNLISFAGGIPDPTLFPRTLIAEAHARILDRAGSGNVALQYSVSEGYWALREWLAAYMGRKGVVCTPENILITNGSQQALYLAARLFLNPGDGVLTERPAYLGALQAFAANEPEFLPLSALADPSMAKAKLVYVMPDFANPTGETMTLADRNAVLDGADRHNVIVIEDGAYSELRYEGAPIASLLALDIARKGSIEASRVVHCGTFSKTVIPGLRIGWLVAPAAVITKTVLLKQANDLHTSTLTQMALAGVAAHMPQSHIAMLCETYGARLQAMLKALAAHMPAGVTWTRPAGGMFVWLTLPESIDAALLAIDAGIAFVPGGSFFTGARKPNTARLSFSLCDPVQIAEGVGRLGRLIAEARR